MITYSSNDLLNLKNIQERTIYVDKYVFNLFYHREELDNDLLWNVVKIVNGFSEKRKIDFVSMFSYLGLDSVYIEYKNLVLLGLDPNICNEWGFTVLHFACILNDTEFVDFLLKNGADPEAIVLKGPHTGKKPINFLK